MSKNKFPLVVKRGNVRVKIYNTPSNGCDAFTVAYYFAGKRQRKSFAKLQLARQEAELVANRICAGELEVLKLTSADRTAYVRSLAMLQQAGTPLEMAVMQFTEAMKLLGSTSLLEAAKFYLRHHPRHLPARTVAEVVEEMTAAKEAEGLSEAHVRDMRGRLRKFAQKFQCPIAMVLGPEMQAYILGLKGGGRTKNNVRKHLKNLFHFAQRRGYLPKGLSEADELTRVKEAAKPISLYQPEEMAKLLRHAPEDMVPFLAIGAFAGLRHAEILRLDWGEIDLAGRLIEVKATKAKTASRRLVPMAENLYQWLASRQQESGRVMAVEQVSDKLRRLAGQKAVGLKWKRNALRHSFISYRVAETQNVAQVALEAGNSPKVIFSNYRELVKPAAAGKWFAIRPEEKCLEQEAGSRVPANVIAMPKVA
jgi:integrase